MFYEELNPVLTPTPPYFVSVPLLLTGLLNSNSRFILSGFLVTIDWLSKMEKTSQWEKIYKLNDFVSLHSRYWPKYEFSFCS